MDSKQPSSSNQSSSPTLNICAVCGDVVTESKQGAVFACSSCKNFFQYWKKNRFMHKKTTCEENCEINIATRGICSPCRFEKCLALGMWNKDASTSLQLLEEPVLCNVCFLRNTSEYKCGSSRPVCDLCRDFFNNNFGKYLKCKNGCVGNCKYVPRTHCRMCRMIKCLQLGMQKAPESLEMSEVTDTYSGSVASLIKQENDTSYEEENEHDARFQVDENNSKEVNLSNGDKPKRDPILFYTIKRPLSDFKRIGSEQAPSEDKDLIKDVSNQTFVCQKCLEEEMKIEGNDIKGPDPQEDGRTETGQNDDEGSNASRINTVVYGRLVI